MNVTFAKCEQILDTLPIGYYAGRRVGVSLKDGIPTSYYSPTEDQITISYPILREGAEHVDDETLLENSIRSMIYHEVSHAILTPEKLKPRREQHEVVNIFEDERIETILRNYYHGVNFRKQVYILNGGIKDPTNGMEAFFNAVRFGIASPTILQAINNIIKRYADMNRNSDRYATWSYISDVWELYKRICEDYKFNPEHYKPKSGQGAAGEEQEDETEEGENGIPDDSSEIPDKQATIIKDTFHELERTIYDIQALFAQGIDIESRINKGKQEELKEFKKTAEMIINNFNKKNSGGTGINAYSGVFNPRAVARQDYRYFERISTIQGNNRFGTCHLNLFIDCSGSFCYSEAIVNGLLVVLSEIERKNRNFSMDVVFCGEGVYKCKNVHERQIECDGGNLLPPDMKEIFLSLQKSNTCNYNIVLFDGDAFSDYRNINRTEYGQKIFSAFDYKQTTLITDNDNVKYLGKGFGSAKVVVTKNYTDELIKHITNALMIAFG